MVTVKEGVKEWVEVCNEEGKKKIIGGEALKIGEERLSLVTTYMREDRERNWEKIEKIRERKCGAVLAVGDFCAITGKKEGIGERMSHCESPRMR